MSKRNRGPGHVERPAPAVLDDEDELAESATRLGEGLRRLALGATAALVVSRAFWPGEPDFRVEAGGGMPWVLALLVVTGLAVAAALVGGAFRFRWSWVDLAVVATVAFVVVAAGHAIDRRPAFNLAWEWVAAGLVYLLLRNLPRTRDESSVLAGTLMATAAAVAVYGLYQVGVELPEVQRKFLANPSVALAYVGIEPGTPAEALFRARLLGSNEPYSTFALANSLAGFLVGPLVAVLAVGWDVLTRRDGRAGRLSALALAVVPTLAMLVCLVLTKSRSAYAGLFVAAAVLAWRERRRVRTRTLALAAAVAVAVIGLLVAAGLATGRLDREVLSQSGKSLTFRRQYWVGAWRAVNESGRAFWTGFGPGNFSAPYVRHKLPEASEDVHDPHNFVLEVWASGGLRAVVPLAVAVALAVWLLLGPGAEGADVDPKPADRGDPSRRVGWVVAGGALGWVAALPPIGTLNPFEGDLFLRWLLLGGAWVMAVVCGRALWTRRPIGPWALGAGALAILVNLLGAGGISVPAVALMLWSLVALGLNLRDGPASGTGRLREGGGRLAAFGAAAVWAALAGTFHGTEAPHFRAEAALARADEALDPRRPDFDRALAALETAAAADRYSTRPWQKMAAVEYQAWLSRGARPEDARWRKVPIEILKASEPPRPTDSWALHRERARWTSLLLKRLGAGLKPLDVTKYRADVVHASRTAVRLYPTNASLRAWLAEASADIGMYTDALTEGREALRLDALTPHADRKLAPSVRQWLEGQLPAWEKTVDDVSTATGKPPAK